MSEPQMPPAPKRMRTMPDASGSSGRSTMRRSSGPNSVAAKAIDVILRVLSLSKSHIFRQPERQLRNVGDGSERQQQRHQPWQDRHRRALDPEPGDTGEEAQ